MKLLIIYASTDGQTKKIATYLKAEAEKQNIQVSLCNAAEQPLKPDTFDAVIIGSSIRNRKFQSAVQAYVTQNRQMLNKMPSALFTVSSAAATTGNNKNQWQLKGLQILANKFIQQTGFTPQITEHIAGAVLFTKYSASVKFGFWLFAKFTGGYTDTSKDYEYTNWQQVSTFLKKVTALAKSPTQLKLA